jgi:hypothetical protein
LRVECLIGVRIIVDQTQILPFRLSAFTWIEKTEPADLAAPHGSGRDFAGCVPAGFEKRAEKTQIRIGGLQEAEFGKNIVPNVIIGTLERPVVMVDLTGDVRSQDRSFRRRKDADVALGIVASAGQRERAVFVVFFCDDVHRPGRGEVAEVNEVRAFVDFHSLDGFRNQPVKIRVPLTMGMANYVDRNTVDEDREVGAVIGVEAPEKNLIGFAATVMLPDNQPRVTRKTSLGVFDGRSSKSLSQRVCSVAAEVGCWPQT